MLDLMFSPGEIPGRRSRSWPALETPVERFSLVLGIEGDQETVRYLWRLKECQYSAGAGTLSSFDVFMFLICLVLLSGFCDILSWSVDCKPCLSSLPTCSSAIFFCLLC